MRPRTGLALITVAASLSAMPVAHAAGTGSTLLVSRPSGLGALPAPGDNGSTVGRRAVSGDGGRTVFTSGADDLGVRDALQHVWMRETSFGQVRLVDRTPGGDPGDASVSGASISRDGSTVCFVGAPTNLVPGVTGIHVYVVRLSSGATEVADRADTAIGAPANDRSSTCSLNAIGSRVAFQSDATNLVTADSNGTSDIFVRDLSTESTQRVSVTAAGGQSDQASFDPAIDASGTRIAFAGQGALVAADTNNAQDVFLRDTQAGTTTRVSLGSGGLQSTNTSARPSISDDGNEVAFESADPNFALSPDSNSTFDVFVRFIGADTTIAVSRATDGALGDGLSFVPEISGNGTAVAFVSQSTNLGGGTEPLRRAYLRLLGSNTTLVLGRASGPAGALANTGGFGIALPTLPTAAVFGSDADNLDPAGPSDFRQVFRRALSGDFPTELVSRPAGQAPRSSGVNSSFLGSRAISADGRTVVFVTQADGLDPAAAGRPLQIMARDLLTNTTTLVSSAAGTGSGAGNARSSAPAVSADGRRVAFVSLATDLLAGGNAPGVFVRDLVTGELLIASRADGPAGAPVSGFTESFGMTPALSADGTRVAFSSRVPLVGTDTNLTDDTYVRDLAAGTTTLASVGEGDAIGDDFSVFPALSADGRRVAFMSRASNLLAAGPTPGEHVYVRDLAARTTTLVDRRAADGAPGSGSAGNPEISADGTRVLLTASQALTAEPLVGFGAYYLRDLQAGSTSLVSRASGGGAAVESTSGGSLSADGLHAAFPAADPALPGASELRQVFVRDLATGTTQLASAADGAPTRPGNGGAGSSALSADGGCVAFLSTADDLTSPSYPTRDFNQVYMHALTGECPRLPAPGAQPPGPPASTDRLAPAITRASMSRTRFALGPKATALTAAARHPRAARGTSFRYTLSEAGSLRITIARRTAGRRSGKRCVTPTRALRRKARCTRLKARVTLLRAVKAGRGSTAFSGRFGRRGKLAPGSYQATLVATDAAGNRSAARTLRFSVVR